MTPYIWPNRNSTYIPWSEIMPKKNQWFIVDIEKRLGMPTLGSGSTHNVADSSKSSNYTIWFTAAVKKMWN